MIQKKRWKAFIGILLSVFFSIIWLNPVYSKIPVPEPQPEVSPSAPVITPSVDEKVLTNQEEVGKFFNTIIPRQMEQENIPGLVVSLVKDGEIIFNKGYGYANVKEKIPVEPDKTLFRVASLSKIFTDTAIMQLYEEGKLNLYQDVSQYLDEVKIKNPYSVPVTAAELMTQTGGFPQALIGLAAPTPEQMTPLPEYLSEQLPPVTWQPGEIYSYANIGITLLGYLVQKISGIPFVEYVDENIFKPLQMNRSSFRQPLPEELRSDLAVGYQYHGNEYKPVPFLYLNIAPAAALGTTATDMAHFMIAHLQLGKYKNQRILEPDTAKLMHRRHFTHHPLLPGTAYGFHERLENNIRAIGHYGNLRGYTSSITLLPEQNVGLFIASNSFNGINENIITQFFDRFFKGEDIPQLAQPAKQLNIPLEKYVGTYRDLEYPRYSIAKLTAVAGHLHIERSEDNTLTIYPPGWFFPKNFKPIKLIPVDNQLFERADHTGYVAFGFDKNGNVSYLFNPINSKIGAYEKLAWYETFRVQASIFIGCLFIFLLAIIGLIVGLIRSRHKHKIFSSRLSRIAWLVAGLVSGLYLLSFVGEIVSVWIIGGWKLAYGVPPAIEAFLYLPPIAVGLTLGLIILSVLLWKNKSTSLWGRISYGVITLASLTIIPILVYWNLLGVGIFS